MSDLLIRNGLVYEPVQHRFIRKDIAVSGGTIVTPESCGAAYEIDAAGCLVTPGLIDFHSHLGYRGSDIGLNTDLYYLPNGVTASVDAGSAGPCLAVIRTCGQVCLRQQCRHGHALMSSV